MLSACVMLVTLCARVQCGGHTGARRALRAARDELVAFRVRVLEHRKVRSDLCLSFQVRHMTAHVVGGA